MSDLNDLGSWYMKLTDKSFFSMDLSVLLMHYDLSDLTSLILGWVVQSRDSQY